MVGCAYTHVRARTHPTHTLYSPITIYTTQHPPSHNTHPHTPSHNTLTQQQYNVNLKHAPDYNHFVPAAETMYLDKMRQNVRGTRYHSVAAFRGDAQRIYDNAQRYNDPETVGVGGVDDVDDVGVGGDGVGVGKR